MGPNHIGTVWCNWSLWATLRVRLKSAAISAAKYDTALEMARARPILLFGISSFTRNQVMSLIKSITTLAAKWPLSNPQALEHAGIMVKEFRIFNTVQINTFKGRKKKHRIHHRVAEEWARLVGQNQRYPRDSVTFYKQRNLHKSPVLPLLALW